jgi:hypothetical protein
MKKIIILLGIIGLVSCSDCDTSTCKFQKGDDIHIKNKLFHDDAVVTKVNCGCEYEIGYFSTFGVRRHRIVTSGEIE